MNVTLTHPVSNFTGNVNFQDGAVVLGFTAGTCAVDLDPKFFNAVASYGILITIGTPGVSPAYDANFDVVTAAITGAAGSQTTGVLKLGYLPRWKATTAYTSGDIVLNPSGQIVQANTSFTSGSSYSGTNWTVLSSGGGGGGVTLTVASTVSASGALVATKHNPVDASGGAKAMTLPTGQAGGTLLSVEKTDASVNPVNVTGSVRGVGATTISFVWQNEDLLFVADAAGSWWPVAGHKTKKALDAAYMPVGGSGAAVMPPPSGDTTGATDTNNLKAALASLPTVTIYPTPSTKAGTSATFHVGTIYLQAAPADVWWDQVNANIVGTPYYLGTTGVSTGDVGNLGPFVSIIGPGHNACVIRYIGTGDALRAYNTVFPSSDTFDTLAAFGGKFAGFTIDGSLAGAGAAGLHLGDSEGFVVGDDLWVANFVGGSVATPTTASKGIFWDNAVSWTENVRACANLYNNTIGVYFAVTTGDLSFMYSSHDYKVYGWPNQYGIMLNNGANFDQGSLRITGNLLAGSSANSGALLAFGTSASPNNRIADSHLDIQAEINGGIPGGSFMPRTIFMASAFYQIKNTMGIWNFGNTGWVASNYNPTFPLTHVGTINGDATLISAQAMPLAGVNVSGTAGTGKVLTASSATAATWQTSAAGGAYYPWLVQGLLGWSFDDVATASTGSAPSSQNITAAKVPIPSSITITNIIVDVMTAGATLTAGSQNVAVVYDSAGNLLGQTADQATNWTTTGSKTMALVTPVAVTGGSGVFVWVGVLTAGTTLPQFARSAGTNNSGMVAPNLRFTRTSTGTITTPPSTASLGSTSTTSFWFGIS